MEDIVAVEVTLESSEKRYFLTWGRLHDAVDPSLLEALILRVSPKFALGGRAISSRLCDSLQEAAGQPYFYECFFGMCQQKIPFGPEYRDWAKRMRRAMSAGKEIYYLGRPDASQPPRNAAENPQKCLVTACRVPRRNLSDEVRPTATRAEE